MCNYKTINDNLISTVFKNFVEWKKFILGSNALNLSFPPRRTQIIYIQESKGSLRLQKTMKDKCGKPKGRGFKRAVNIKNLTNYFLVRLIALFLVYFQANN